MRSPCLRASALGRASLTRRRQGTPIAIADKRAVRSTWPSVAIKGSRSARKESSKESFSKLAETSSGSGLDRSEARRCLLIPYGSEDSAFELGMSSREAWSRPRAPENKSAAASQVMVAASLRGRSKRGSAAKAAVDGSGMEEGGLDFHLHPRAF
jgi:hypothetical protein